MIKDVEKYGKIPSSARAKVIEVMLEFQMKWIPVISECNYCKTWSYVFSVILIDLHHASFPFIHNKAHSWSVACSGIDTPQHNNSKVKL